MKNPVAGILTVQFPVRVPVNRRMPLCDWYGPLQDDPALGGVVSVTFALVRPMVAILPNMLSVALKSALTGRSQVPTSEPRDAIYSPRAVVVGSDKLDFPLDLESRRLYIQAMTFHDVTGQRFGKLIALHKIEKTKPTVWAFLCDCGKETNALIANVKRGMTQSCGCGRIGPDITNVRFGRLTALRYEFGKWVCQCDCGNSHSATSTSLRFGYTKSCGCLKKEVTIERSTKHGMSHSAEYDVWSGMRNRCQNPNNESFFLYGQRGITVCDRWSSFENFYADMGPRPTPRHSIDRLNNELGYSPENCEWGIPKSQANNRRSNRFYEYQGKRMTLSQMLEVSGSDIKAGTARARLAKGWSAEDAIGLPVSHAKP